MSQQISLFERARRASQPLTDFDTFWEAYAYKVDKGAARRAWKTACKKEYPHVILAAVKAYVTTRGPDRQFWPYPARWLNGERWEDQTKDMPEVQQDRRTARLEANAKMIRKGMRLTTLGPTEARECLAAGLITEKEARDYGA